MSSPSSTSRSIASSAAGLSDERELYRYLPESTHGLLGDLALTLWNWVKDEPPGNILEQIDRDYASFHHARKRRLEAIVAICRDARVALEELEQLHRDSQLSEPALQEAFRELIELAMARLLEVSQSSAPDGRA
jgi:hypothetical protein